jgi:alcohol dehydrogenase (cytochrome c)
VRRIARPLAAALLAPPFAMTAGIVHAAPFAPVTDAMLRAPAPSDWLMFRRTYDDWGYSPLDDIDRSNVARLELVWSRDLENESSQEGTPLVHDGTMYFPEPLDVITAMDAASGKTIWQYRRELPDDVGRYVPNPQTNRNLAIYDRLIIDSGSDDFIYAVDAETGRLVWQTKIVDYKEHPAKQGSGPLVVKGKLVSGRNCMPQGGPEACVITAHDARSGRELWRLHTIPRPEDPGGDTWGSVPYEQRWHVGAWMVPSYDPDLDLVYMGTSVTAPAPKFMLAGNDKKYLYHNSTLAIDPDDGKIVWYYQHLVDHWDLDHTFERMLVDTAVAPDPAEVPWINPRLTRGERRRVVTGIPGKTGIVYTLDRATGEFLWARPTVEQNVVTKIDGATGDVIENDSLHFTAAHQTVFVCPTTNGGKNWPAGAYSPRTKTMYFPMANTCMKTTSVAEKPKPELIYAIESDTVITPGAEGVGTLRAIAVESGATKWRHDERAGLTSLVATGGDLVFGGDVAGKFRAYDAETGAVLWETDLGAPITGFPITYAAGGRQYVAVSTGRSNLTGALGRLTPDVRAASSNAKLFVFALPLRGTSIGAE